jgi:hypothetical protein
MGQRKAAYLLGGSFHAGVIELERDLIRAGVDVRSTGAQPGQYSVVLLCLTEPEPPRSVWKWLDANPQARVLPVLFMGGRLPAIYADIKAANYAANPAKAVQELVAAIDRFA